MLLCSNVATARSGDEQLAATQLRELGALADRFGVRVAYEALAWGRFVDDYETAARIVRLADHPRIGVCLDSFHILSKGHDPEAIEHFAAAVRYEPGYADARLQLAGALIRMKRYGEAHAQLTEGAARNPERPEFARALEQFQRR